jgi:DNA-binding HxlR family transcriptional regulator
MKPEKKTKPERRSDCAVACTLDIIGDRWTLLVVRDLQRGKRHFDDFLRSPEGIATNVLSARLRALCEQGWVKKLRTPPITGDTPTSSATMVYAWGNCSATSLPGASKAFPEREF